MLCTISSACAVLLCTMQHTACLFCPKQKHSMPSACLCRLSVFVWCTRHPCRLFKALEVVHQLRLCRFNVYHAVHSTSLLPLSKVTQVLPGDPFTIFASACPDAFPDDSPPLAEMSYDRRQTIREHRQLGISMKSASVYVSASCAALSACRGLCLSRDHTSHQRRMASESCPGVPAMCAWFAAAFSADWMC